MLYHKWKIFLNQSYNMIIEIHSQQKEKFLFTAWQIPEYAWENRKDLVIQLFNKYFEKYNIQFIRNDWQDNIIFYIGSSEKDFNKLEKVFDKYFSTIKVLNVVN